MSEMGPERTSKADCRVSPWVCVPEYLRYSVDVFDERDSLVEVLGRLAGLSAAHAAFEAALAKYPGKRLFLRERARDPPLRQAARLTMARKPPPAKPPRRWRIIFVAKGRPLGTVEAPDVAGAIEAGAKLFGVDPARLIAQPLE